MKIAIVEDEASHAEYLQALLQQWSREHQTILEIIQYSDGEALLNSQVYDFDLVFLDIQMNGLDGVTTAHRLRELKFEGHLVFLTAFSEYVFEGYDVQALNYLMKPVAYEKIEKCLDHVFRKIKDDHYTIRNNGSITQVPYSQIIYFSSANHYTKIITTDGFLQQFESMRNIFSHLPNQFHYCHRTVIINMEHVKMLKGHELTLSNNTIVPVSVTYLQEIRSALLAYADNMR